MQFLIRKVTIWIDEEAHARDKINGPSAIIVGLLAVAFYLRLNLTRAGNEKFQAELATRAKARG